MFGLETLLWLGVTGAASVFGYLKSRQFVRRRLRFVDAVQNPVAPLFAGGVAWLVAIPVASFLPVITAISAVVFGVGVGAGVLHGARDVKRLPSG
jgi:membrane associated rhomboid family serine protease